MMYSQLDDYNDLIANRRCNSCELYTDIYQNDLVYTRNPDAFWKKECYAYCKSNSCKYKRLYVSKRYIPTDILSKIPKDKVTKQEIYEHYLKTVQDLRVDKTCKNCNRINQICYDKLLINRSTDCNLEQLAGFRQVYYICDNCPTKNMLYSDAQFMYVSDSCNFYDKHGFKAFVEKHITNHDNRNSCLYYTTVLKNLPIHAVVYGLLGVLIWPISRISNYRLSKDQVVV